MNLFFKALLWSIGVVIISYAIGKIPVDYRMYSFIGVITFVIVYGTQSPKISELCRRYDNYRYYWK